MKDEKKKALRKKSKSSRKPADITTAAAIGLAAYGAKKMKERQEKDEDKRESKKALFEEMVKVRKMRNEAKNEDEKAGLQKRLDELSKKMRREDASNK